MKQKDLALIIVIGFIGAIASLFISKSLFVTPKNREQQVEVVQPISAAFQKPDKAYFNTSSLDPTKVISISQNTNSNPF
jgi:hypothetical protein